MLDGHSLEVRVGYLVVHFQDLNGLIVYCAAILVNHQGQDNIKERFVVRIVHFSEFDDGCNVLKLLPITACAISSFEPILWGVDLTNI